MDAGIGARVWSKAWIALGLCLLLAGACAPKKKNLIVGEQCEENSQCLSGLCGDRNGQKVCQRDTSCTPGSTQPCTCSDGKQGSQACGSDGKTWGQCTCTGSGLICAPGATQACSCASGKNGRQTCNGDGKAWGQCTCDGGQLCTPGGTQACVCPNGQNGSQTCNSDGKAWGQCTCQSQACTPGSTQGCSCGGGKQGSQTCNSDGKGWGQCQGCGGGQACTPGATQACACAGGKQGSQTCNSDGKSYGACQCGSSGKKKLGESCQQDSECDGAICIEKSGGNPYCSQLCKSTDCPAGYACANYDETKQVCGKIRPNAKDVGASCQSPTECKSLICWVPFPGQIPGVCVQRCEETPCPSGLNCVTSQPNLKFCSTGVCNPGNVIKMQKCAQSCTDSNCFVNCLATHTLKPCQDCYVRLSQCAQQSGCDGAKPTCCTSIQKQCFGG